MRFGWKISKSLRRSGEAAENKNPKCRSNRVMAEKGCISWV